MQGRTVRDLELAETCLVTLRPKKLKKAMLNAITTPDHKTVGLSIIWCQPRGRSKKVEREAHVARKGMRAIMVVAPKRPSRPTA